MVIRMCPVPLTIVQHIKKPKSVWNTDVIATLDVVIKYAETVTQQVGSKIFNSNFLSPPRWSNLFLTFPSLSLILANVITGGRVFMPSRVSASTAERKIQFDPGKIGKAIAAMTDTNQAQVDLACLVFACLCSSWPTLLHSPSCFCSCSQFPRTTLTLLFWLDSVPSNHFGNYVWASSRRTVLCICTS